MYLFAVFCRVFSYCPPSDKQDTMFPQRLSLCVLFFLLLNGGAAMLDCSGSSGIHREFITKNSDMSETYF